ncbi:MAG: hypothetical protein KGD73_01260 [Candidatus Lokiarchaeota archaeon]|nr:hypothetical protein [Candidatus Lokiarchaeota archaeon]
MMKVRCFFEQRIVSFILQFILLTLLIYGFNYSYQIDFDADVEREQIVIIQFLANYVLFRGVDDTIFMYSAWLLISFLPILINIDCKKAYSANLLTYFVLNFFVYVFLFSKDMRVTDDFFTLNFITLIWNTILLGFTIIIFSILVSFLLKKIKPAQFQQIDVLDNKPLMICPKCGTEFQSIPMFCYNCNTKLINEEDDNSEV